MSIANKILNIIIIVLWLTGMIAISFSHSIAMLLFSFPAGISAGNAIRLLIDNVLQKRYKIPYQ